MIESHLEVVTGRYELEY